MRRLVIACAFVFVASSAFAAPILPLAFDTPQTWDFFDLQAGAGPDFCYGGGCVTFNLLGGSGTIAFDVLTVEGQIVSTRTPQAPTMGFGSMGIGLPFGLDLAQASVRVTLSGDLQFDYFSVAFGQTLTDQNGTHIVGYRSETYQMGERPILPPHVFPNPTPEGTPEPASLALLGIGAVVLSRQRRRHVP